MHCPVCQNPLIVVERHDIELDYCLGCRGLWFDEGEIAFLLGALQLDYQLSDPAQWPQIPTKEQAYPCPRCHKKMNKVTLGANSPLVIDRCPKGEGLWFDAGELAKCLQAHATGQSAQGRMIEFLGEVLNLE